MTSPRVRICLFGGVSVADDRGVPIDVGPAKGQTVLAALALSAGTAVPVSRLVDLVWGQQPPRTADKTLQWYIARLRQSLGPDAIVRVGAAYRLEVDADAIDVLRFKHRLASGDLDAALEEWVDRPLAGLDAPGLAPTIVALVEQWLGAIEIRLGRLVDTDPRAAVGPLTELTADYPFHEGLWSLLMTALYRMGRQADALAAFRTARRHLVEELGVEPGPRLRDVETRILEHDEQLRHDDAAVGSGRRRPTGTVTFGFSEVEGSTRLWTMDPRKTAAALSRLDTLVRSTTDAWGGHVFAAGWKSFGAAFERADDAAAWATELQATVRAEPWPGGFELRLRVGLHTGETEERGSGYFGPAVHTAARVAAAGHGRQILVSGVTADMLDGDSLRDLGAYRLDGVTAELRLVQLGEGDHPPLRTDHTRRGNLPRRLGRVIGRQQAIGTVTAALTSAPVVTLVGPGGIGKTRLALAVAQLAEGAWPAGVWLVELAEIAASSDVPRAVADTIGIDERAGHSLTQSLVAALRSRRALIVLDNCEHVLAGAAALARTLAEQCVHLQVLATSREGLGITDERRVTVEPLDPNGSGAELFNERASAVSPTFDPHAGRGDVEQLCRRLDGVPLAIELAAARTSSLTPADLIARLDDGLRLLTGGRGAAERQRTLRATIQWSYDLLTVSERTLFETLTVFAGPFDLAAAEHVAADADLDAIAVDDLLGILVDRSMVMVEAGPFGRRFRLLETMRQFGAHHLAARDHTERIASRHARWCLDEVTRIQQLLTGPAEVEGVARLGELWPNLRSAVDRACEAGDRALAHALVRPVAAEVSLRSQHEIGDWAERILEIAPAASDDDRVIELFWAAHRYQQTQKPEAFERLMSRHGEPDHLLLRFARAYVGDDDDVLVALAPEAVAELRRLGEDALAEHTEATAPGPLLTTGRHGQADTLAAALADRYRAHGPPTLLSWALVTLGYSAMFQGRHGHAARYFDEAAAVHVPDRTLSVNKLIEARAAFRRGDQSRAFQILHSHIDDLTATDNVSAAAVGTEFITMMTSIGRLAEAALIVGHVETLGRFGALASDTIIADAVARIAAEPELDQARRAGKALDPRQALQTMHDVLGELTTG